MNVVCVSCNIVYVHGGCICSLAELFLFFAFISLNLVVPNQRTLVNFISLQLYFSQVLTYFIYFYI